MEKLIEKYSQYLEKPDIDGVKILYYVEHLLKSRNVGIREQACTKILDKSSLLSVELYPTINCLMLVKQGTEFHSYIRLKRCFLNQKGSEFLKKLIEKAKETYVNDSIEEFNQRIEELESFGVIKERFMKEFIETSKCRK